jgi:hypothetical protein
MNDVEMATPGILAVAALLTMACIRFEANSKDLGGGFSDHGVATPISNHRGTVATVDGDGHSTVLSWLMDHRGGYALLEFDVETGESAVHPMPFPVFDSPFASILSSRHRFYTHVNSHFCEFDAQKGEFTFVAETVPMMAMGMTEDDDGVIWAASYPDSGLMSYDPETGEFNDYGHVYEQNWRQYQRTVAADETGWVYFGVGNTRGQIIAFNRETREAIPMIPDDERAQGTGYVYRNLDGKVYGQAVQGAANPWFEFYGGKMTALANHEQADEKPIITGSQGLFHTIFPDGKELVELDLIGRVAWIDDPRTGDSIEITFDYETEGAHLMGVAAASDGTLCGGTAFPMRFFSYNPATDAWVNREAHGQWNTVAAQGEKFFVGGYGHGFLLEWTPANEWVRTDKENPDSNPRYWMESAPTINRPHDLLVHPDGRTVILAGTPGYGYTGGGLLIWDRQTETGQIIEHTDLIPLHSTQSLIALPDGNILGGTTVAPGTGGEQLAEQAELYLMDLETRTIQWHEVMMPGVSAYSDLRLLPSGMVIGVADWKTLFVFDPEQRTIIHQQDLEERWGRTNIQQGPRIFVWGEDDELFMLTENAITRVDLDSYEVSLVAESPVEIGPGGDYYDGRIYFGSGSHLYSYQLS